MAKRRRTGGVVAALIATAAAALMLAPSATAQVPPTGVSPSPSALDFGKTRIGSNHPAQVVHVLGGYCLDTIGPRGEIIPVCKIEPMDVAVSGPFTIVGNWCPAMLFGALGPGQCSVAVAFAPQSRGPQDGFLRLQSSPRTVGVPLTGKGCRKQKTKSGKKKLVCMPKK